MKVRLRHALLIWSEEYGPNFYSCPLQERLFTSGPELSGRWIGLICDFLNLMLEIDPKQRASIEGLLCHRFWLPYQKLQAYPCKCGEAAMAEGHSEK